MCDERCSLQTLLTQPCFLSLFSQLILHLLLLACRTQKQRMLSPLPKSVHESQIFQPWVYSVTVIVLFIYHWELKPEIHTSPLSPTASPKIFTHHAKANLKAYIHMMLPMNVQTTSLLPKYGKNVRLSKTFYIVLYLFNLTLFAKN